LALRLSEGLGVTRFGMAVGWHEALGTDQRQGESRPGDDIRRGLRRRQKKANALRREVAIAIAADRPTPARMIQAAARSEIVKPGNRSQALERLISGAKAKSHAARTLATMAT
jgi:hypothetical protein